MPDRDNPAVPDRDNPAVPDRDNPAVPDRDNPAYAALLGLIAADPEAPTTVTHPAAAREVHIEDSLAGLDFPQLAAAERIADLGSGAGFPGLVLAIALPGAEVDLIEATGRKCRFLERAVAAAGVSNVRVVCDRAESWAAGEGAGRYEAVTARAVGPLAVLAELASPLLADGGSLLAWKGARNAGEERGLESAGPRLAMVPEEVRKVRPYPASRDRHIHLLRKNGATPDGIPRRPGMAAKRPFGSE